MAILLFLFLVFAFFLIFRSIKKSDLEKNIKKLNEICNYTNEQLLEYFHKEKLDYLSDEQKNIHMAYNYECRKFQIKQLKKLKAKTVKQLGCCDGRDCSEALKNHAKIYSIKKIPKLPCKKCDAKICRCAFVVDQFYDD